MKGVSKNTTYSKNSTSAVINSLSLKKQFIVILLTVNALLSFSQESCDEFVWDDKIYKPCSNWLTMGYGYGYNFRHQTYETNGDASFHIKISDYYLQAGYFMSSNDFFLNVSNQRLNDIHLGIGKRIENQKQNIAFFIGPTYSYGKTFYGTDTLNRDLTLHFAKPGVYANVQYIYKILYDIGVGVSMYVSINKEYPVMGLQLQVYFSGAYKGKIR